MKIIGLIFTKTALNLQRGKFYYGSNWGWLKIQILGTQIDKSLKTVRHIYWFKCCNDIWIVFEYVINPYPKNVIFLTARNYIFHYSRKNKALSLIGFKGYIYSIYLDDKYIASIYDNIGYF